jgi:hypothetical protein
MVYRAGVYTACERVISECNDKEEAEDKDKGHGYIDDGANLAPKHFNTKMVKYGSWSYRSSQRL